MSGNGDKYQISRRNFVKTSAFLGGTAAIAGTMPWVFDAWGEGPSSVITPTAEYQLDRPESLIYSACLQCHNACTLRGKVLDGVVVKVDGSPYGPQTSFPHLGEDTPLDVAARADAKLCPKGQAGIQTLYDPYRLRKVLKRVGPRGSGQWETIDFNQAVDEIVNGGDLFGEGPVPGLKETFVLKDADVAKAMADDAKAIGKGEMTVAQFKRKHTAHLDALIDPDHPDLGPKNNQFVVLAGRIEHGRKELGKRFLKDSFGSVNWFEHTTICEQSHHIAFNEMTLDLVKGNGSHHMKPDLSNSEFVIFFGASPFDATFGPLPMVEMMTSSMVERNFKFAVVDPRLSKTAAKAWRWIPIKPGADGALAMAMVRWIIENERYDRTYLENANNTAAEADDETSSTDATHLVRTDEMVFLRPEDAGLTVPAPAEGEEEAPQFVVMTGARPTLHSQAEHGRLEVDTTVNGIAVKSVFTLLKERAQEKTLEEYAEICGPDVSVHDIEELAYELTNHGKKAAAELYRGPVQHTNGYHSARAIITLNVLLGNVDHKSGLAAGGGHWHEDGSKDGQPYPLKKLHPGKLTPFGINLTREGWTYAESSTLFEGFPAKRPWYPFTGNVYQEVIPAAGDGYPYPIKALFLHKGTPALSCPGAVPQGDILRDTSKIPLFFTDDVVIGDTAMFADYVFPDLTYLERWGTPHTPPSTLTNVSKMRQPVAAPIPEEVEVDGELMPISLEAILIALGKKLGLPGFGQGGFGEGGAFNRPEDYFLHLAANLAFGDEEDGSQKLPAAGAEEMEIFRAARAHLPPSVFDEARWKAVVGQELWPSVVYLLNRGGRFEAADKAYDGDKLGHRWGGTWHLFTERVAKTRDSITGERFDGLPRYEPIRHSTGKLVQADGYQFTLITFKEMFGGHSRTVANYWAQLSLVPENFVIINKRDGERLGLSDGDEVKLVSATNTGGIWTLGNGNERLVAGKVKAVEGIRPGVVAVSWHYGHWAYGANDVVVDGETIKGDERRARGLCPNAAMLLDEGTQTTCLTDPIGGSASFYDTPVNLVKV